MLNTPPTFGWYFAGLVFKWLQDAGRPGGDGRAQPRQGASALRRHRRLGLLPQSRSSRDCRSWMNVPFTLAKPELDKTFLGEARQGRAHQPRRSPLRRRHARQHLQRDAARGRRGAGRLHAATSSAATAEAGRGHMGFRILDAEQHQHPRASSACRAIATRSASEIGHPDARAGALGRHAQDGSCRSRCWPSARAGAGTNNIPVAALSRARHPGVQRARRQRQRGQGAGARRPVPRGAQHLPGLGVRARAQRRRRTPSTRRSRRARRTSSASSCPGARSASSASARSASRWPTPRLRSA